MLCIANISYDIIRFIGGIVLFTIIGIGAVVTEFIIPSIIITCLGFFSIGMCMFSCAMIGCASALSTALFVTGYNFADVRTDITTDYSGRIDPTSEYTYH